MERVVLYLYSGLVIQMMTINCYLRVDTSLVSTYPCDLTENVKIGYEPDSTNDGINYLYVTINEDIPANSVVKASFDAEVNVFMNGKEKWTNMLVRAGDFMELLVSETRTGLSFVVKRTAPGRASLTSLTIDGVELCDAFKQRSPWGGNLTDSQCGRRITHPKGVTDPVSGSYLPLDTGSVVDGHASPGHWPWHVGLFKKPSSYLATTRYYECGGTLVSNTFVLTAAHCIGETNANLYTVEFGKFNLKTSLLRHRAKSNVAEVIVHEGYNKTYYLNDIALLKLKSAVQMTDFIRPACLWYRRRSDVTNMRGVLVGWGYSDAARLSGPLQQVNLPLVSDETCIKSNPTTASSFMDGNNFCVGYLNPGTSLCKGDDGGAFQVFIPDAINGTGRTVSGTWYVKGVLSFFVNNRGEFLTNCNNEDDSYSVFTDVEKYAKWLDSYIKD